MVVHQQYERVVLLYVSALCIEAGRDSSSEGREKYIITSLSII